MVATKKANRISGNGTAANLAEIVTTAERIIIPKPDFRRFKVRLRGLTSYMQHHFSDDAARKIIDKQQQKAKQPRGKRDPHAEYLAACYLISGKAGEKGAVYGIPCRQIKAAMVAACRYVDGLHMVEARGICTIMGEDNFDYATLQYEDMRMSTEGIRLPNKALDLRYRPEWLEWSTTVVVEYLATAVSAEQLINLLSIAGRCCGIGEWRPNSSSGPGGSHGMFEVETAS
jgi:hypothetical protein